MDTLTKTTLMVMTCDMNILRVIFDIDLLAFPFHTGSLLSPSLQARLQAAISKLYTVL